MSKLRRFLPREYKILKMRYVKGWTYTRIAREFGVDVQRIRMIEGMGIRNMFDFFERYPEKVEEIYEEDFKSHS